MTTTTNLRKTNKKSIALSTQVPREIMNVLGVSEDDKLNWIIEAVDNSMVIRVEKAISE